MAISVVDHAPLPPVAIFCVHTAHTATNVDSRPIRRYDGPLVKSRFASTISNSLEFSQRPGLRPARTLLRFRFSLWEIFFCSIEGVFFFTEAIFGASARDFNGP